MHFLNLGGLRESHPWIWGALWSDRVDKRKLFSCLQEKDMQWELGL